MQPDSWGSSRPLIYTGCIGELVEEWKSDAPSYIERCGYSTENTVWGAEKRDRRRI